MDKMVKVECKEEITIKEDSQETTMEESREEINMETLKVKMRTGIWSMKPLKTRK